MNLEEMRRRKKELGYSNKRIAELSGVPLGTVQKIFSGATRAPREESLRNIWHVLGRRSGSYQWDPGYGTDSTRESNLAYEYDGERTPDIVIDSRTRRWRRQGTYTVADVELLPEDFRVELIDGVLYDPETPFDEDIFALAAPSQQHQALILNISSRIHTFIEQYHPECVALTAPSAVRLEENSATLVEPDILVVCDKSRLTGMIVDGPPDFIIEVLSRATMSRDMDIKLRKYWRAGVREYWVVNPFAREVVVYHFAEGTPPDTYSFTDKVPVGITGGELVIDFEAISQRLKTIFG